MYIGQVINVNFFCINFGRFNLYTMMIMVKMGFQVVCEILCFFVQL